jgi:sialidase-1
VDARDEIRFARFNEEYLGWRNSAGPTTPDTSRTGADAIVLGGATRTTGRFGGGVALDGTDNFLRVPYDPAQLPGAGDLTYTTWFRYGGSTAPQALLWLGGMGGTTPQLWLRAEPAANRLVAWMTTPAGSASVTTTNAYADGQWHHLALQRSAGRLSLWVDGVQVADGPGVAGSLSERVSFQVHIGQRQDNQQRFTGTLDEVRLYRRALTPAELDRVRLSNADIPADQVLRLPLDKIRGDRS